MFNINDNYSFSMFSGAIMSGAMIENSTSLFWVKDATIKLVHSTIEHRAYSIIFSPSTKRVYPNNPSLTNEFKDTGYSLHFYYESPNKSPYKWTTLPIQKEWLMLSLKANKVVIKDRDVCYYLM